jgi:hypothetical protein
MFAAAETAASGGDGKPADGAVVFAPPSFAELFKGSPFYATSAGLVEGAKVRLCRDGFLQLVLAHARSRATATH